MFPVTVEGVLAEPRQGQEAYFRKNELAFVMTLVMLKSGLPTNRELPSTINNQNFNSYAPFRTLKRR